MTLWEFAGHWIIFSHSQNPIWECSFFFLIAKGLESVILNLFQNLLASIHAPFGS